MKVIQLHKNEKALLLGLQENRREAQKELYGLYAPKMLGVCRQYIKDLQNDDFRIELIEKGFNQASKFSWKRTVPLL